MKNKKIIAIIFSILIFLGLSIFIYLKNNEQKIIIPKNKVEKEIEKKENLKFKNIKIINYLNQNYKNLDFDNIEYKTFTSLKSLLITNYWLNMKYYISDISKENQYFSEKWIYIYIPSSTLKIKNYEKTNLQEKNIFYTKGIILKIIEKEDWRIKEIININKNLLLKIETIVKQKFQLKKLSNILPKNEKELLFLLKNIDKNIKINKLKNIDDIIYIKIYFEILKSNFLSL